MLNEQQIKQEKVMQKTPETQKKSAVSRNVKPKISMAICQKNFHCVVFCPKNAVTVNAKGEPNINYDLCDGCLICLRECPAYAITEEKS